MEDNYILLSGKYNSETFYSDLRIDHAENCEIIDTNGKRYYDLRSGLWNVSLGYDKNLYEKVKKDFSIILDKGIPYLDIQSYQHTLYEETSKIIIEFLDCPQYEKCFFTNSGSESIELAIKIAKKSNAKGSKIITLKESYHGNFFGGMSVSGMDQIINMDYGFFNPNVIYLPFPDNERNQNIIFDYLDKYHEDISFFVIEPVISSGGLKISSELFYNKLLFKLRNYDIISIFDEVATGFYRTGTRFFSTRLNEKPDILCLSKSINNGITPFGAVVISKDIEKIMVGKDIEHFSTQNGNLLGMISTKNTINFMKNNEIDIIKNVNYIQNETKKLLSDYNLRCIVYGAMIAIEINSVHILELVEELKKFGILVYMYSNNYSTGLTLFPVLTMDVGEFKKCLNVILKKGEYYARS